MAKLTKRERLIINIMDWAEECQKYVSSNHHLTRIETHYGVTNFRAQLDKMTVAQLSVVLCLMVANNTKAHEDQRKWKREHMVLNQSDGAA